MTRWKVELLNETVEHELSSLKAKIRGRFVGVCGLLERYGPHGVELPHIIRVRRLLWEMRINSNGCIAKALFQPARTRRILVLCVLQNTNNSSVDSALERASQLLLVPRANLQAVKDLHARWKRIDPAYAEVYSRVGIEIQRASSIIRARTEAQLTQAKLAERLDSSSAVISRLESGKSLPSPRMLKRLNAATGVEMKVRGTALIVKH